MSDREPMSEPGTPLPKPAVHTGRRWSLSLIWLVPAVAALAGFVLVLRAWLASGPAITIHFDSAEGLEAGTTEVRYKDVVVGKVKRIRLSKDHEQVLVKVELSHDAADLAVEDTKFWIVRPRIGLGGVSGLNTLLSGAYIGVDLGRSKEDRSDFDGLEVPPAVTTDQKGRRYMLEAADLGSLDIGSPLYFRREPVGRVVAHKLRDDGRGVTLEIFVNSPYDRFVTNNARFWNASGVDVSASASGFKLNTESLAAVVAGGVAFQAPSPDSAGEVAAENAHFTLFDNRDAAMAPPDGVAMNVRMRFNQSMRGLVVGAPVDFRGVVLGNVTATALDYDTDARKLFAVVDARIYPERLGELFERQIRKSGDEKRATVDFFTRMIGYGLRAQMRPGNLLTGQLYVSLDFDRKAGKVSVDRKAQPFELPTVTGGLEEIQQQIADIVNKIDQIPFDEIGNNLNGTLKSADSLLKQLDGQVAPEARQLIHEARDAVDAANQNMLSSGSPLQRNTQDTLASVDRMARSLRELADYLKRHPESLVFGKQDGKEPSADGKPEKQP
ncbi:intermembrane transport protein PqiB [Solimonas terrae]|uniref:MCE family protein n=1 Tax=Solimonas terrae TaxID=1396819 RepID=A0A6M2BRS6_9GAMM|nr:MlaD family protein [Solimonas terrae]NGY04687.1 MCE family protein [Solimonas terrae]